MLNLRDGIVELYKKVATSIPNDVEDALKKAYLNETGTLARESLKIILQNISIARATSRPICQDTGFPVFFVKVPEGLSHQLIKEVIVDATRISTKKIPLRPNAVDIITEKNTMDNVGEYFPLVYMEDTKEHALVVDLMLKGGGCENLGQTYNLPTMLDYETTTPPPVFGVPMIKRVAAERDFDGIRKSILDAVFKAQGRGCPPYTIGIAVGGAKDQVAFLSKKQLMRKIPDAHSNDSIANLEDRILNEINYLKIGASGLGGQITAIGVKIAVAHRHPASYFVDVSFSCWANRRGRLVW